MIAALKTKCTIMNAIQQVSTPETELKQGSQSISFAEFLESVPPLQVKEIDVLAAKKPNRYGTSLVMLTPEIRLYCGHDGCNGMRFFRAIGGPDIAKRGTFDNCYLTYMCSNCHQTAKTFSVAARLTGGDIGDEMSGQCYKFGESPAFARTRSRASITLARRSSRMCACCRLRRPGVFGDDTFTVK